MIADAIIIAATALVRISLKLISMT